MAELERCWVTMKLGLVLLACAGCSQALAEPVVGRTDSRATPCPSVVASSPPAEPVAPGLVEAAAAPPAATGDEIEGLPAPELDGTIAFAEYNDALDRVRPPWESDAALVIARALDAGGNAHTTITIELLNGSKRTTDSPNVAKATIVRDDFADDSIRGTRYLIELRLDPDRRAWRIATATADWRCWRGHASYSTALCQ
jgi:hypothetical protein